jgi:hypothetical protein
MAPSNALTVEEIINGFPNPVLHKIYNEPTFEDIQVTSRLLNANAISITSMAGGGAHGHLGIIMTQVEYAAISASPWVETFNTNAITIINPTQLAENYNKMTAPINFQDPIEKLFKKIEDGVRYANAGMQPNTKAQYVNIAFLLILNTGAIPDACRYWQRRTLVNQTWADFRREFARDQQEQHIISSTARGAGYHT